jgi:hypothetical protein
MSEARRSKLQFRRLPLDHHDVQDAAQEVFLSAGL